MVKKAGVQCTMCTDKSSRNFAMSSCSSWLWSVINVIHLSNWPFKFTRLFNLSCSFSIPSLVLFLLVFILKKIYCETGNSYPNIAHSKQMFSPHILTFQKRRLKTLITWPYFRQLPSVKKACLQTNGAAALQCLYTYYLSTCRHRLKFLLSKA